MGGRVIWGVYRTESTKRGDNIHQKRMRHERYEGAKDKHEKIHHQQGGRCERGVAVIIMDKTFPTEPRIRGKQSKTLPRQHDLNVAQKERTCIKFKQE